MEKKGKSERIIENLGCGPFQVILYFNVAIVSYIGACFSNHFMAFGNYNPGWRCLDPYNHTLYEDILISIRNGSKSKNDLEILYYANRKGNETIGTSVTSGEYKLDDCSAFEKCKNVEFNPEASTIVTEWGLVCEDAWIPSFIISLQMSGLAIGAGFAGVAADAFGRKLIIYLSVFSILLLNFISVFSSSWQMFAFLRLLLGIPISIKITLFNVYASEFMPSNWRATVLGMPSYPFNVVIFGITCLILKDWRDIHIATCVVLVIALFPMIWLPRSLRWLEVKNKMEEFKATAQKVAKYNNKTLPVIDSLNSEIQLESLNNRFKTIIQSTLHLFRGDYRKYTFLISIPWLSASLIYYSIAFGVKALSGNFYFNLIMFYAMEVVIDSGLMFAPNYFGRKKAGIVFCGLSGICLLVAACFQEVLSGDAKGYGVATLAMLGRISISAFWAVLLAFLVEIYPTVIRGAANSWGLIVSRIGGVLAPILIPSEANTVFICYATMGVLAIISVIIIMLLPETKGKALQETFQVNVECLNKKEKTDMAD